MQLRYLCTDRVVTIGVDESIDESIRLFEEHQVRHLPVVREGVPVGMVSQGDVLASVGGLLSEDRVSTMDPTVPYAGPTTVEQIMTTDVVALPPETPLIEAAQLMLSRQIAAVVVVGNEGIMGIVSARDYLRRFFDDSSVLPDSCCQQRVADHMSEELTTASPDEGVFALFRDMGKRIHHLPVVEEGRFVGILSDHDVWRALAIDKIEKIRDPGQQQIHLAESFNAGQIMQREFVTITPDATLGEAARIMIERKVGCAPVLDGDELVGILTETDVLQACLAGLTE